MKRLATWMLAPAFVVLCACGSLTAANGDEEVLTLEVAPDSVACVGEMTNRCIQVRSPGQSNWRIFHDPIEGFKHEVGVKYTLEVGRRVIPNPPADGSAYRYRLIQIIGREPAAR